jgi:hypothetical protein
MLAQAIERESLLVSMRLADDCRRQKLSSNGAERHSIGAISQSIERSAVTSRVRSETVRTRAVM